MFQRSRRTVGFIESCLPTPARGPLSGPDWLYEIKHDGFRIMAGRDATGVWLDDILDEPDRRGWWHRV
jgi:ATP-dependent DNA ligase